MEAGQQNKAKFDTREIVFTARCVDNVYPGMSFSSYTSYYKLRDNAAHSKKVLADIHNQDFIQHLEAQHPCTLTGEKLPKIANYGWRSICNIEMDRILACGPSCDPVLHRGMFSKLYIKDKKIEPF